LIKEREKKQVESKLERDQEV